MNHGQAHAHDPAAAAAGHEIHDADVRVLAIYGVILTVFLVVVHFGLLAVYRGLVRSRAPEPPITAPVDIYEQLHALRQAEDETLTTYGWVDRNAGVVRVPIARAIELAASRGVPHGKGPRTEAELNSHHGIPARAEEAPAARGEPQPRPQPKDTKP